MLPTISVTGYAYAPIWLGACGHNPHIFWVWYQYCRLRHTYTCQDVSFLIETCVVLNRSWTLPAALETNSNVVSSRWHRLANVDIQETAHKQKARHRCWPFSKNSVLCLPRQKPRDLCNFQLKTYLYNGRRIEGAIV